MVMRREYQTPGGLWVALKCRAGHTLSPKRERECFHLEEHVSRRVTSVACLLIAVVDCLRVPASGTFRRPFLSAFSDPAHSGKITTPNRQLRCSGRNFSAMAQIAKHGQKRSSEGPDAGTRRQSTTATVGRL